MQQPPFDGMMNSPDILVAEDNPNDVRLTLAALEPCNVNVAVVRDGSEVLDFLFETGACAARNVVNSLKLILLDLKLPKLNGLEVIERVKADARTRCIPIIVLTHSSEERDLIASYQAGVNSYLVKPVDFEQFSTCMQSLVNWWLHLNHLPDSISSHGNASSGGDAPR